MCIITSHIIERSWPRILKTRGNRVVRHLVCHCHCCRNVMLVTVVSAVSIPPRSVWSPPTTMWGYLFANRDRETFCEYFDLCEDQKQCQHFCKNNTIFNKSWMHFDFSFWIQLSVWLSVCLTKFVCSIFGVATIDNVYM